MNTEREPPAPDEPTPPGQDADDPHAHLRRPRQPHSGRFVRSMETVRRDAAVADYLAEHPDTSWQQLADMFGFCHRSDARHAVERAKADVARPAIDKLLGDESRELDALYAEAVAILQRNHITVSQGKVITWRNPETQEDEPLLDDGPKLQAIQTALKVRESYRKLHGLDQPAKTEVSGGVTYEVVGITDEDLK